MSLRATTICLLTFSLVPRAGWAAKYELEQKKGLILFQGFTQWASLNYDYSASSSNKDHNSFHDFQERYNFSTSFAVVDPLLLQINGGGSLGLEQSISYNPSNTSKSHRGDYQYNISGSALSGSWHPINFNSSYTTNTVVSPFTPTYTTSTAANGVLVSFLGKPLETTFGYQKTAVDTSGTLNSSSNAEQLNFTAVHKSGSFSASDVAATYSLLSGTGISTTLYQASLNNVINLTSTKTLATSVQWQSQTSTGIPQENLDLAERYLAILGKVLISETNYQYHKNDTSDFSGKSQSSTSQTVSTSLQHRLFESLSTNLIADAGVSNYLGGKEERYGGSVGMHYNKRLTQGNSLSAGVVDAYGVVKRNLASSDFAVRDEPHTVAQQGDSIILGSSGILKTVVSVFSKNPDQTDLVYLPGRDYTFDSNLRQITVVPGGIIAPGTALFISYVLSLDPSVSFSTNTVSLNSTVTLRDGKYGVNALYTQSSVNQISGQSQNDLNSTRVASLSFQGNLERVNYGVELGDYLSGPTNYRYLDASWRYKYLQPDSIFSLVAKDRYTQYGGSNSGGASVGAHGEDSFSASSVYTRFFTGVQGDLAASYAGNRGGTVPSDYYYLKASLRAQINQLVVSLSGQSVYRIRGGQTSLDSSVNVNVVRYF